MQGRKTTLRTASEFSTRRRQTRCQLRKRRSASQRDQPTDGLDWFGVLATNADGQASQRNSFDAPLQSPTKTIGTFEGIQIPEAAAHLEQVDRESQERFEAERRAREAREHPARAPAIAAPAQCVVPALFHHTLKGTRWLLGRAHCKLGHVTSPRKHHGALVVIRQSLGHGKRFPNGTAVAVTLGPAPPRHSRTG